MAADAKPVHRLGVAGRLVLLHLDDGALGHEILVAFVAGLGGVFGPGLAQRVTLGARQRRSLRAGVPVVPERVRRRVHVPVTFGAGRGLVPGQVHVVAPGAGLLPAFALLVVGVGEGYAVAVQVAVDPEHVAAARLVDRDRDDAAGGSGLRLDQGEPERRRSNEGQRIDRAIGHHRHTQPCRPDGAEFRQLLRIGFRIHGTLLPDAEPLDEEKEGQHGRRNDPGADGDFGPGRQVEPVPPSLVHQAPDVHTVQYDARDPERRSNPLPGVVAASPRKREDHDRDERHHRQFEPEPVGLPARLAELLQLPAIGEVPETHDEVSDEHPARRPGQRRQQGGFGLPVIEVGRGMALEDHHGQTETDRRDEKQHRQDG